MPYAADRAASRFGRDRDLLPDAPQPGPYEAAYDVRRGYQQPLERVPHAEPPGEVMRLAAREAE